jgi:hypothetical protein
MTVAAPAEDQQTAPAAPAASVAPVVTPPPPQATTSTPSTAAPASVTAQPSPAATTQPPNTVPMVNASGQFGYMPHEHYQDAISAGYEPAVKVIDPKGQTGYMPQSKLSDAKAAGYKEVTQPGLIKRFQNAADTFANTTPFTDTSGKPLNGTGYDTGVGGQFERFGQGVVQGSESVLVHPVNTAHSTIQLPLDMLHATGWSLTGKLPDEEMQAARDRLKAQWDYAKENPAQTLGQFAGADVVGEATGKVTREVVGKAAETVGATKDAVKGVVDTATGATKDVRQAGVDTIKQQTAVDQGRLTDQQTFEKKMDLAQRAAQKADIDAQADWQQKTDAEKLAHANKVGEIQAENEAAEKAATETNDANQAEAQRKYQENVQASQDTESERGQLARQEIQARLGLWRRMQQVAKDARANVNAQYGEVRSGIKDALTSNPPKVVQPPWQTLLDTTEQAKESLQGSQQKIPIFESILKRANEQGDLESQRRAVMDARNIPGESYDDLKPEHKALVDEAVQMNAERRATGEELPNPEENGTPTASWDHLSGYSSELGKELRLNPQMDGDIKQAIIRVKSHIDAMRQEMANRAGMGAKLQSANKNWYTYKDVFHENTGPSGSGSPVAKGLKAEDATNATEPFLSKDAEIASRARQMLVGQPFRGPGSYFNPGAGYLVDKLRDIRAKVESLPKPKEPEPYQEPKPVVAKTKELPAEPTPKPKPAPTPINYPEPPDVRADTTPLDIREIKDEAIQRKIDTLRNLDKWQARALLSAAGGAFGYFLGHSARGSIIGSLAAGVAPSVIGWLADSPTFRDWASAPHPRDIAMLQRLKGAEKITVQNELTGQIERLARNGPIKVAPEIQGFVGANNLLKIGKAVLRAKRASGGMSGAEKIREAAKTALVGAARTGLAAGAAAQSQKAAP